MPVQPVAHHKSDNVLTDRQLKLAGIRHAAFAYLLQLRWVEVCVESAGENLALRSSVWGSCLCHNVKHHVVVVVRIHLCEVRREFNLECGFILAGGCAGSRT